MGNKNDKRKAKAAERRATQAAKKTQENPSDSKTTCSSDTNSKLEMPTGLGAARYAASSATPKTVANSEAFKPTSESPTAEVAVVTEVTQKGLGKAPEKASEEVSQPTIPKGPMSWSTIAAIKPGAHNAVASGQDPPLGLAGSPYATQSTAKVPVAKEQFPGARTPPNVAVKPETEQFGLQTMKGEVTLPVWPFISKPVVDAQKPSPPAVPAGLVFSPFATNSTGPAKTGAKLVNKSRAKLAAADQSEIAPAKKEPTKVAWQTLSKQVHSKTQDAKPEHIEPAKPARLTLSKPVHSKQQDEELKNIHKPPVAPQAVPAFKVNQSSTESRSWADLVEEDEDFKDTIWAKVEAGNDDKPAYPGSGKSQPMAVQLLESVKDTAEEVDDVCPFWKRGECLFGARCRTGRHPDIKKDEITKVEKVEKMAGRWR